MRNKMQVIHLNLATFEASSGGEEQDRKSMQTINQRFGVGAPALIRTDERQHVFGLGSYHTRIRSLSKLELKLIQAGQNDFDQPAATDALTGFRCDYPSTAT